MLHFVHHDVQRAEGLDGRVHQPLQILDLAHVSFHTDGLIAEGLDLALQVGGVGIAHVVDDDVRRPGQGEDDRFADSTVATGDDGHPSFERIRGHAATSFDRCSTRFQRHYLV